MESEILELEKKYWQAMEDHDFDTVKKLTRFPCIVAGKNGVQSVDEAAFKNMFESGSNAKIKVLNISNVESQAVSKKSAVIAYHVELGTAYDVQGPSMKCACTSTWTKEDDGWLCALHTEAELAQ
ncbi:nuclear transport factor 2 family protein [Lacibacter sp. H375]|uniref:nuclear transport factor 2 family protein n=1 Tax=Lacibacter sp. H375 TaxID=3133424 RepID=UPI0030C417EF